MTRAKGPLAASIGLAVVALAAGFWAGRRPTSAGGKGASGVGDVRDPQAPPVSASARVGAVAKALGKEPDDLMLPRDPIARTGDLKAEVDAFTTLASCVASRAPVDPLVGDALEAIGYDTFLHDTCRLLEATQAKSTAKCDPIVASALRERCASYVAIAATRADDCPIDARPERGRDPTCVAVASRDARLCDAVAPEKRPLCVALASSDDARCAPGPDRDACVREVRRWAGLLGAIPPPGPKLPEAALEFRIEPIEGSPPVLRPALDLALDRGVVVSTHQGETRITLGALTDTGGGLHAVPPLAPLSLGIRLVPRVQVARVGPGANEARVDAFELDVPGGLAVVDVDHRLPIRARFEALDVARGGEVHVVVDVESAGPKLHAYKIHLDATTWVRDVVAD